MINIEQVKERAQTFLDKVIEKTGDNRYNVRLEESMSGVMLGCSDLNLYRGDTLVQTFALDFKNECWYRVQYV